MQGVIKSYDPGTGDGLIVCDTDLREYELSDDALAGSLFRMVRQGQRVVFELNERDQATRLRIGSEVDMGAPSFPGPDRPVGDAATSTATDASKTEAAAE